jgi:hypothetical protein
MNVEEEKSLKHIEVDSIEFPLPILLLFLTFQTQSRHTNFAHPCSLTSSTFASHHEIEEK